MRVSGVLLHVLESVAQATDVQITGLRSITPVYHRLRITLPSGEPPSAECYDAFFSELFERRPQATVVTTVTTYYGRDHFATARGYALYGRGDDA